MRERKVNIEDCQFIIKSLDYTIQRFESYSDYPSYEFKLQRIDEAKEVRQKMLYLRDALKRPTNPRNPKRDTLSPTVRRHP